MVVEKEVGESKANDMSTVPQHVVPHDDAGALVFSSCNHFSDLINHTTLFLYE